MDLISPYWFDQRQGKAEAEGPDAYRLTAPNLKPAVISIQRGENGRWSAALRLGDDTTPVAQTEPELARPEEAWEAAFELYRVHLVV
jgi:hypothetical protein